MQINSDITSSKIYINLVKLDHILFKINGYKTIFDKKKETLSNHHDCQLGKWYKHEWKEKFGKTASYKKIYSPHEIVHKSINEVIQKSKEGDLDQSIICKFEISESASLELFDIICDMTKEAS